MSISTNWYFAAGLLLVGVSGGAYVDHSIMESRMNKINAGHAEDLRVREVKRADDERSARERENSLVQKANEIEQRRIDETDRIRSSYAADIARLQNRPDRKPANPSNPTTSSPTCQGSTGAELSRPDAVFLSGEATRADELRSGLSACYQAYDSVAR